MTVITKITKIFYYENLEPYGIHTVITQRITVPSLCVNLYYPNCGCHNIIVEDQKLLTLFIDTSSQCEGGVMQYQ